MEHFSEAGGKVPVIGCMWWHWDIYNAFSYPTNKISHSEHEERWMSLRTSRYFCSCLTVLWGRRLISLIGNVDMWVCGITALVQIR